MLSIGITTTQQQEFIMNNTPQFSNSDLQRDSLGDALNLNPEDIMSNYDGDEQQPHTLVIGNNLYRYIEEYNRDHDRDLAMALLLKSMQDDDGVTVNSMIDGDEIMTNLESIHVDTDGSIYVQVKDQDGDYFAIPVTQLVADGYEIHAASPATVTKKESIAEATLEAREKYILENRVTDIRLGDYVETIFHKHRGRVTDISEWCDAGNSNHWFRMQTPPYDKAQKMERWITILVHGGGSVCVAESRATITSKFDFVNPYADKYFRDTPSFTSLQIDLIKELAQPLVGDGDNHEYTRGICELIADIDPKGNMCQEERAEELRVELTD